MNQAHFRYILRLGDDSLILGQQLSGWSGHAPSVEVDLSLSNLALDLIGQATYLLGHAATIEAAGRDADGLAFHRDAMDFENCLLVEQDNGDFARTMARQLLFSTWQHLRFERLCGSTDAILANIATKAVKEISYHAALATDWVIRLGDGTEESHRRMSDALAWHWRFLPELFDCDAVDDAMIAAGIGVDPSQFKVDFDQRISDVLRSAGLAAPPQQRSLSGGRQGRHSEALGHILADMQFLPRAYPDAKW